MTPITGLLVAIISTLAFWSLVLSVALVRLRRRSRDMRSCLDGLVVEVNHLDADLDTCERTVEGVRNLVHRLPTRSMPSPRTDTGRHAWID